MPTDPREDVEMAKLLTGVDQLMPVEEAITEYLHKTVKEAQTWRTQILQDQEDFAVSTSLDSSEEASADPQGKTRNPEVNPRKKGSQQGLANFHGLNNK